MPQDGKPLCDKKTGQSAILGNPLFIWKKLPGTETGSNERKSPINNSGGRYETGRMQAAAGGDEDDASWHAGKRS